MTALLLHSSSWCSENIGDGDINFISVLGWPGRALLAYHRRFRYLELGDAEPRLAGGRVVTVVSDSHSPR